MSKLTLYHGSPEIIQMPVFGKSKAYHDAGSREDLSCAA